MLFDTTTIYIFMHLADGLIQEDLHNLFGPS